MNTKGLKTKKYILIFLLLLSITTIKCQVWTQKASCPYGAFDPGFFFSHESGKKIYVAKMSANSPDSILYFNTLTNTWHYYGLFPGQAKYSSAICVNDKAYVFSGKKCFNVLFGCYTSEVWELDLLSNVWTQKANFPNHRMDHSLTYNPSSPNTVYINFGLSAVNFTASEVPLTDSYTYDITTDSYSQLVSFAISGSGRYGHTAYCSGNTVNIYWGASNVSPAFTFGNNLTYNLLTNTWVATGTTVQRKYGVTFELGGVVYVGMGYVGGDPVTQNTDFYAISPLNTSIPAFPGTPFYKGISVSCGGKGYLGLGTNLVSGFEPAPRTKLNQLWEFNPLVLSEEESKKGITRQNNFIKSTIVNTNVTFDIANRDYLNVSVLNTLGQTVLNEKIDNDNTNLNISHLTNGLYYLRMRASDGEIIVQRIIKQ
jgi:hypothetical protein